MRKFYLSLAIIVATIFSAGAQLNYSFSPTNAPYQPLKVVSAILTQAHINYEVHDEGYTDELPIGFTFNYNGTDYTTISANTNGFASFVPFVSIADPLNQAYWLSDLHSGSHGPNLNRPILAPLWDDLDLYSPNDIKFETTGTTGTRVFTLQWGRVYWTLEATQISIEFQLKLYEGTNVIEFVYNRLPGSVGGSPSAAIGITAATTGNGNYISLSDASTSPTASSTVNTYTIATRPATGQIYRFTPGTNPGNPSLNYGFTALSGTYTPIAGAEPALVLNALSGSTTRDEGIVDSLHTFFNFNYNGTNYSYVSVHTNGILSFRSMQPVTIPRSQSYASNDLHSGPTGPAEVFGTGAPSTARPLLAPLWDDLALTDTSDIKYEIRGTAPNRVFIVEWARVRWNSMATGPIISFQVKLYETTNVIEFHYQPSPGSNTMGPGAGASIGITSANTGPGNFISLNNSSASPGYRTDVSTNNINTLPADGQVYRFTPSTSSVCNTVKATTDVSVTAQAPDNFFAAVGDTREVNVTAREIGGYPASGVSVRVAKAQASGYLFTMGTGFDSNNWTRTEDVNFVYFTRTGGLPCGTNSTFVINMTRANPAEQQFSVSFGLVPIAEQSADYRFNDTFSVLFVSQN